jgi:hypothetical protein
MRFQGAVVREQGVTFAIVVVKPHVLNNAAEARDTAASFYSVFPGMPIILMAQDSRGVPQYYGRHDIVDFLASIHYSQIPWREYTLS